MTEHKRGKAKVEDTLRYFHGTLSPEEKAAFEHRAANDDEFARQAGAIYGVLETLGAANFRVDERVQRKVFERERAARWRRRLRDAVEDLAARGYRQFARLAEEGVEAALEITLGTTAKILDAPAAACLRPGVVLRLAVGPPRAGAIRVRGGTSVSPVRTGGAARGPTSRRGRDEEGTERAPHRSTEKKPQPTPSGSAAAVVSSELFPSVRVGADAEGADKGRGQVQVDFRERVPESVLLIPEDPRKPPLIVTPQEAAAGEGGGSYPFRDLKTGRYLLVVGNARL